MSKNTYWKTPDGAVYEMPSDFEPAGLGWEQMPQKAGKAAYRADRIAYLRELFPPGAKVFCTVTNVARSGMSRSIRVFAMVQGDAGYRDANVTGCEPRLVAAIAAGLVLAFGCDVARAATPRETAAAMCRPHGGVLGYWLSGDTVIGAQCRDGTLALLKAAA